MSRPALHPHYTRHGAHRSRRIRRQERQRAERPPDPANRPARSRATVQPSAPRRHGWPRLCPVARQGGSGRTMCRPGRGTHRRPIPCVLWTMKKEPPRPMDLGAAVRGCVSMPGNYRYFMAPSMSANICGLNQRRFLPTTTGHANRTSTVPGRQTKDLMQWCRNVFREIPNRAAASSSPMKSSAVMFVLPVFCSVVIFTMPSVG